MAYNTDAWGLSYGIGGTAFSSADASTAVAITSAPTTGEKIVLVGISFSCAAAMEIAFEEETSGTEIIKFHMPLDGSHDWFPPLPIVLPTANKKLFIDTDTAGSVTATAIYYSTANGLP